MPYRTPPLRFAERPVAVGSPDLRASFPSFVLALALWCASLGLAFSLLGHRLAGPYASTGTLVALCLLGIAPASLVWLRAAHRGRRHLALDRAGIRAEGLLLVDLERPFDACVLQNASDHALVIAQGANRLVLHGAIATSLGGRDTWGPRWHEVDPTHLSHRAEEIAPGATWSMHWALDRSIRTVIGPVGAGGDLAALAERVLAAAAEHRGALLVVPTAHADHPVLTVDADGVLHAFGEHIDTRLPFERTYVWANGKENATSDADAIILQQGSEDAVRLAVTPTPGRWPKLGALPGASIDLPAPDVPAEEVLSPAAFGAVDGFLTRASQR